MNCLVHITLGLNLDISKNTCGIIFSMPLHWSVVHWSWSTRLKNAPCYEISATQCCIEVIFDEIHSNALHGRTELLGRTALHCGCWRSDRGHLTCHMSHVTCDLWHVTNDYFETKKCQKSAKKVFRKATQKSGQKCKIVSKRRDFIASMLISAHVERVLVSRVQGF